MERNTSTEVRPATDTPATPDCVNTVWKRDKDGYGRGSVDGQRVSSHRHAWEQANGPIPAGMHVLHHCDNRACVKTEPDDLYPDGHLWLGTNADNMADKVAKGRANQTGTRNNNHRLTEAVVRMLRAAVRRGESQTRLARSLGVSVSTVNLAVNGKTWTHVK